MQPIYKSSQIADNKTMKTIRNVKPRGHVDSNQNYRWDTCAKMGSTRSENLRKHFMELTTEPTWIDRWPSKIKLNPSQKTDTIDHIILND